MSSKTVHRNSGRFDTSLLLPLAIAIVTAIPFFFHATYIVRSALLERVEDSLYDAKIRYETRIRAMFDERIDKRIVIVDIDDISISREGQWPWSRDKIALLVDNLFDKYGVRAVAFDMVFSEPDRGSQAVYEYVYQLTQSDSLTSPIRRKLFEAHLASQPDRAFAESLINRSVALGYIFLSTVTRDNPSQTGLLPPALPIKKKSDLKAYPPKPIGYLANLPILQSASSHAGFFDNPLVDVDGLFRRIPLMQYYEGGLYESLALSTFRMVNGLPEPVLGTHDNGENADVDYIQAGAYQIPVDDNVAVLVPYRGRMGSFPYISATDVLKDKASIDTLFDSIVLVGTTAPALFDLRSTPVGHVFAGVEIHANLISGMLDGRFWFKPDWVEEFEIGVLLFTGLVLSLLLPRLSLLASAALFLGLVLVSIAVNFIISFGGLMVLPVANSVIYAFILSSFLIAYSVLIERRKKRYLSRIFGKYVPVELVTQFEQSEAEVSLEGEARELTVLFSDVRDFTRMSEGLPPTELTSLMNAYLTPVTEAIHDSRGNVDKYIGDAVMAFWGAPLEDAQHARHAIDAAMAMVDIVENLRHDFVKRGWPELKIGIGVNTGVMNVGNMGSEYRTAYTVMGDAVNLGSRLEGLSKVYGVPVVVGEETVKQVGGYLFRELDRVRVKGKEEPITIYEPMGQESDISDHSRRVLEKYVAALSLYRQRDWAPALAAFESLSIEHPEQGLFRFYASRCQDFVRQSPPEDWDGVFNLTTK